MIKIGSLLKARLSFIGNKNIRVHTGEVIMCVDLISFMELYISKLRLVYIVRDKIDFIEYTPYDGKNKNMDLEDVFFEILEG